MNVVEPILFQCRINPLTPAISAPGSAISSVSYDELGKAIHNAARSALRSGIAARQTVGVFIADTVLHATVVFSLTRLGVATVSLRDASVPPSIAVDLVLTDTPHLFTGGHTVVALDGDWVRGDGVAPDYDSIDPGDEDDICRIILTSGSTGQAKGVAFSHKMLNARIAGYSMNKGPRFAHCSRFFSDLGFGTSPGFRYAVSLLSRGGTIYFLGSDPSNVLQAFELHRIQGMATSPYGLGEYLRFFEAAPEFDVSLDFILCQGAQMSPELSRRVRARLCQNLYSSYGATETATIAFGPASLNEAVPGAVGYVQPWAKVEIIDSESRLLPNGTTGVVRVRTRNMASGYVGDPESTREHFRDGYFYSGDIGHVTPDDVLVIAGRERTALNISGDKVAPEMVEAAIMSYPGISEAGVFAFNDELGIARLCAVVVSARPFDEASLRDHCAGRLAPSTTPLRYLAVDSLPRLAQGKIDRSRLVELAKSKLKPS
jgi:acyl-CoA synthetase (AMP-forming)/AMP-acid ligase II